MAVGIYILHLYSGNEEKKQDLLQKARRCVDPVRLQKAEHLKNAGAKAASLGAGLLLQKMAQDLRDGRENEEVIRWEEEELIAVLKEQEVIPLEYRYGTLGKPEIPNFPKHFNLSHSGDYVVCGVSDGDVGVDIQKWVPFKERTAERFFAPEEWQLLQETGEAKRTEWFYRLWTRKEAYGKYTGQGIGEAIGENLSGEEECRKRQIVFREIVLENGYSVAVCFKNSKVTDCI